MKRLYDNWVQLDGPNMNWAEKKLTAIIWQLSSIKRHIRITGSVPKGIIKWWHLYQICRKTNKTLLRLAKESENKGMKQPPTPEELAQFKQDMGGDAVLNTHCMERVKSKAKNLNMDIKYGD